MGGRILIADDLVTDRIALKARLSAARHCVIQARGPEELAAAMLHDTPDAVVMDMNFPGGGVAACRRLKSHPTLREIPVLLYGAADDRAARIAAFEAGADECLAELPGESLLLALLRNLMRRTAERRELLRRQELVESAGLAETAEGFAQRASLVLVPADKRDGPNWRAALAAHNTAHIRLASLGDALDAHDTADAFVIALPPEASDRAFRLVSELRARPATRHAVIVLQSHGPLDSLADFALDLGADAVMRGPFAAHELAARIDRLLAQKRETDRLRALVDTQLDEALRDPLTGLFNRRYADRYLARLTRQMGEDQQPFALLLLDLDHFKSVNDQFGHIVGDEVLARTAARILNSLREVDLAARIGGEEFLIVLRDTGGARARKVAERVRHALAARPIRVQNGAADIPVTASIGVALGSTQHDLPADLMERADRALYGAKAAGRNQVIMAPEKSAA